MNANVRVTRVVADLASGEGSVMDASPTRSSTPSCTGCGPARTKHPSPGVTRITGGVHVPFSRGHRCVTGRPIRSAHDQSPRRGPHLGRAHLGTDLRPPTG